MSSLGSTATRLSERRRGTGGGTRQAGRKTYAEYRAEAERTVPARTPAAKGETVAKALARIDRDKATLNAWADAHRAILDERVPDTLGEPGKVPTERARAYSAVTGRRRDSMSEERSAYRDISAEDNLKHVVGFERALTKGGLSQRDLERYRELAQYHREATTAKTVAATKATSTDALTRGATTTSGRRLKAEAGGPSRSTHVPRTAKERAAVGLIEERRLVGNRHATVVQQEIPRARSNVAAATDDKTRTAAQKRLDTLQREQTRLGKRLDAISREMSGEAEAAQAKRRQTIERGDRVSGPTGLGGTVRSVHKNGDYTVEFAARHGAKTARVSGRDLSLLMKREDAEREFGATRRAGANA